MLVLAAGETPGSRWSTKIVLVDCSCGRKNVPKVWAKVASGHTSSCGSCNLLSKEHWTTTRYGKLRMLHPAEFKSGSGAVVPWMCDCGKTTTAPIAAVTSGTRKSCGRCNEMSIHDWGSTKWGKLRMKNPQVFMRSSGKRVWWTCDCGKETLLPIVAVTRGHNTSCGKCGVMSADFWQLTKFGRLRLQKPADLPLRSNKKLSWVCDCGGVVQAIVQNVTRGRTVSCGKCRAEVDEWFITHRKQLQALKPPIAPQDIPPGPFCLIQPVERTDRSTPAVCAACGQRYAPRWEHVRLGTALTCGCCTNRMSMGQQEVAEFVRKLGFSIKMEHKLGGLSYDVFVPDRNLVIEYQGLRWHSTPGSKQRDWIKYRNALEAGMQMMSIYEDEWKTRRNQMSDLLRNRLGKSKPKMTTRASSADVREIKSNEASRFYDQFHYIGRCKAGVHYGAYVADKLVACCSFSRPTRQSKHPWELVRMVSDPSHRVHGMWSKLVSQFVSTHKPTSIVSFSDNRLFTGGVYGVLGFTHDGDTPQSYYWVKDGKRHHKSGLRKRGNERHNPKTETELRSEQGYSKLWDLGKKRWVWRP